ncbi:Crinkler (CRN) family protein [Phytophthora palmivora]|uniref:Crinkler (CRN) family protein n=1 Tax=Phytophthora palmivora TaxID=4796 RepID=A0A2P4X474_9STRA|nr:Crinkler (CRN) family protein [Phytophthora palmivora]
MALGVAPSLPPTTIHRHPKRLKRWAAINAMIRRKNQGANQKTTSEDAKKTNKKRKNHDVDKTVGYSDLCWEDIKPIYKFNDSYDLQPSDIPDADIELLLARIVDTVSRLLKNVRILVEEDVVGKNVLLNGRFEFVLNRGVKRISLVVAKREDMLQGLVQNVTGLEALADVEDLSVVYDIVYDIVTNFLEWKFLISEDERMTYSPEEYLANKERIKAPQKRYYQRTREARLSYQNRYDDKNREHTSALGIRYADASFNLFSSMWSQTII